MTDREAFLAAILTQPDDVARLVFADWLEEHDEPQRAELLRIQCELAKPAVNPHRLCPDKHHRGCTRKHGGKVRSWEANGACERCRVKRENHHAFTQRESLRARESALIANPALRRGVLAEPVVTILSDKWERSSPLSIRSWQRGCPVVELPLAEWGRESNCIRCVGTGFASPQHRIGTCFECSGQGRYWQPSPVCERLMREAGVMLWVSDKRPADRTAINQMWYWFRTEPRLDYPHDTEPEARLPDLIFSALGDVEYGVIAMPYASAELALAELNAALQRLTVRALWPKLTASATQ